MTLRCIGILAHPHRPRSAPVAHRLREALSGRGIDVWSYTDWSETSLDTQEIERADVVIAIGGDGAMLKASRVCAPYEVPVLGLNMGRLGFLTEIASPDDTGSYLPRLLDGDYWIETRMMIRAGVIRENRIIVSGDALNDVVISGGSIGRMVQLDTYIDNHWTTTYNADALLIATPTGSTAYALAVGGPILPPDLTNILIVPSAAHLSMDRPIVLSEGSQVNVRPASTNRNPVIMMVDGMRLSTLSEKDIIHITASPYSARFIRMRGRDYFYRSLLDRLEPRVSRESSRPETLRLELPDGLA